jgi:hypothetical protein
LNGFVLRLRLPAQEAGSGGDSGSGASISGAVAAPGALCCSRQAGHQQPAALPTGGTVVTGGKRVHQQGALPPSAMAQPNAAPQRVQVLMKAPLYPYVIHLNGARQKIQYRLSIMPTLTGGCL